MRKFHLVVITGLPGTGKSTLARQLAQRHGWPLIAKDAIKEALMDSLDAARSRQLSNAAFAVMFSLARELVAVGNHLILEGNFRRGEHEVPLLAALPSGESDIIQVLCRMEEVERRSILLRRAGDPARHPGHADAHQLEPVAACDSFLELPGERRLYRVGCDSCETLF